MPWRVSINVSPRQFQTCNMHALIGDALQRHGLEPGRLVVEVTEGVLISDSVRAVAVLTELRHLGMKIALDDFGTGYSSLSYLQLFRFNQIKIDQSFIRRLGQSDEALTLTHAIVNLGHNLGLSVTAEGVETPVQLAILKQLGCDHIQGYLIGRPATVDSFKQCGEQRIHQLFNQVPDFYQRRSGAALRDLRANHTMEEQVPVLQH